MNEDFSFMNEKIKAKPFYRKRWVGVISATVMLAVIFGAVSSFVFVKLSSQLENRKEQEKMKDIEIPKDHPEELQTPGTESQAKEGMDSPVSGETELTLEQYGKLHGEMQKIAREAASSLVTVTAVNNGVDWFNKAYESQGQASGMIVGNNEVEFLILTEYAVVKSCDRIDVTFADHKVSSGTLKKYDKATGLAVVSVSLNDISEETKGKVKAAELGNSVNLKAGEPVMAIGRADGSENSMKSGTITSVHVSQSVTDAEYTILVTDMCRNAGADGVLINLQGQVLGILQEEAFAENMDQVLTAYGISDLKGLIEHLSNDQQVTYLGIKGVSVTAEAQKSGIPKGVYVTETELDSPAMLGGIQNGDIIQKIDGYEVMTMKEVFKVLQKFSDKKEITLNGQRFTKDGYKAVRYEISLSILN